MLKKNIFLFFIVVLQHSILCCQSKNEFGLFLGTSYYMGDLNPSIHQYMPSPAVGGKYTHNLNKRYALSANVYYGGLQGEDKDNLYPHFPVSKFKTNILESSQTFDFYFMPFTPKLRKPDFTSYISCGLSESFNMEGNNLMFVIPFAVGVKYSFNDRFIVGYEWSFNKTFNDKIDNIELKEIGHFKDAEEKINSPVLHHNDMYFFMGVFIMITPFGELDRCKELYE